MKRKSSKNQKVFSPKFDLIFKKLFIENGKDKREKYLIDLLNTIYNYDKEGKKTPRIRSIEFIKKMDQGFPSYSLSNSGENQFSATSPTFPNKYSGGAKHYKTNNIFNRFTDPKLNENKTFVLDCICYVSTSDTDIPSLVTVSTGQSFLLHLEMRDHPTEYNYLDIINYINNQVKYQQILYFQQNMLDLMSPQSPTSPSSSKFSCFKKIPNIRSLYFLKNEEVNSFPCLYHVNPVIFDHSLENGSFNTKKSSIQFYESSTIKDLTTVIQLSKINDTHSNINDQCLKDWLNFISIGYRKSLLITEKVQ
ncbi:hypothetical protein BCR36DRAFT_398555 [Piromyces finnis]|uniref:Uncharacterized protein n=1 Tax=Piromyces finnis TaxID=1754191 RepID=A0A1Y1V5P2_9FUNG|nr:hypothetical protein BCR36DRAFT_398555 [Piromyces finnis]|eukprot:ORX47351.1 hypothetical protein BCR36DRAFT_398555 [Piromyces finnis]